MVGLRDVDVYVNVNLSGFSQPDHQRNMSKGSLSNNMHNLLLKDALHNSTRCVIARTRAVCGVAFLVNSTRYWLQNAPSISSRSALHPLALSYAEHP